MDIEKRWLCVVDFFSVMLGEPVFQVYLGELFRLALAVTSLNRYPELCEAICRRRLVVLVSWY